MFGLDQFYLQGDYSKKKKKSCGWLSENDKNDHYSHVVYQKRGPACALFKIGNARASPKIFRECYKQKSIRATTPPSDTTHPSASTEIPADFTGGVFKRYNRSPEIELKIV